MIKNILLCFFALLCSCMDRTEGFTAAERERIGVPGAGAMRLWTVSDARDSVLLRAHAQRLSESELSSDYFAVLCSRMLATVTDPQNDGVGIAAPQVGISRRLIAVQRFDREGEKFEFYVNPSIDYYSASRSWGDEGCLSIENTKGRVMRSDTIVVSYDDLLSPGGRIAETVTGFTAVIFQHEVDHLDGKLFTDYITQGGAE